MLCFLFACWVSFFYGGIFCISRNRYQNSLSPSSKEAFALLLHVAIKSDHGFLTYQVELQHLDTTRPLICNLLCDILLMSECNSEHATTRKGTKPRCIYIQAIMVHSYLLCFSCFRNASVEYRFIIMAVPSFTFPHVCYQATKQVHCNLRPPLSGCSL